MHKCDSNTELSECFADFFIIKIEKIRSNLDQHPLYQPVVNETMTKQEVFKGLSQDVKKVIMHMQTKSCESDTLPMKFVKEHLDTLLPIITNIVTLSLINGILVKRLEGSYIATTSQNTRITTGWVKLQACVKPIIYT